MRQLLHLVAPTAHLGFERPLGLGLGKTKLFEKVEVVAVGLQVRFRIQRRALLDVACGGVSGMHRVRACALCSVAMHFNATTAHRQRPGQVERLYEIQHASPSLEELGRLNLFGPQ